MGLLNNRGFDRFLDYIQANRPNQVEVSTDIDEGGDFQYVCEYFGIFTANYDQSKPVRTKKKYGGTTSDIEQMNKTLEEDIKRIEELGFEVKKLSDFKK